MRYIGIIILLVLCLTSLSLTGYMINTVKPETASGNLETQEEINQRSNNSQSSSTGLVYETVIADTGESVTVYPQQWATGDGTVENPWTNDCIQKAYNNVPDGGTIFLRAGYYILSDVVEITRKINIIGEGMGKTIITTANAYGFWIIETNYVTIKNLTIDGDAQTDGTLWQAIIGISNSNYALLEDIEVKNAGYYGIDIYQVNHSSFQNIYAHDNYSHGLHPGANAIGTNMYNVYRDIYAWDNGSYGFYDRGTETPPEYCYNIFDNINCWDNGLDGIGISAQKGSVLSNSFSSGNGRHGISTGDLEDCNIHDCYTALNEEFGIYGSILVNVNLTNVIVKNNSLGMYIANGSDVAFTSCQFYDDRGTPLQTFGLYLSGTSTGLSLLNCKLTPNSLGEIYNPAGAVVTVITEKRE